MKKRQRFVCCAVITVLMIFAFVGCSRGNNEFANDNSYPAENLCVLMGYDTVENNTTRNAYGLYIEMDAWLETIKNENILLFDLYTEGIGVSGNGVVLPPCIPESNIAYMKILQMLPYNEFIPSDGIIVDSDKVSDSPVLLIELLDMMGSRIGLMATHSRIIGVEGKECLAITRTDLAHLWSVINHRDRT